ncbi:MAG: c-type cytochrome [Alphaproteobacteria bacterium]|nr:c-type cytochrome [Alphaproteobacteria bacterium]
MSRTVASVVPLLALLGCNQGLDDNLFATGSATAVTSADHKSVFAVNPAIDGLSRFDVDTESVTEVVLEGEPTRVARAGDRLLVTLRTERALAVVDANTLEVERTVQVGAEPFGVVTDEAGSRAFVTLSQQDEVIELDLSSFEVTRRWTVTQEPRWLALEPDGRSLFVGSTFGARLTHIDLRSGEMQQLPMPSVDSTAPDSEVIVELTPRLTGDPAISPDGEVLAVPMLWVDNLSDISSEMDEPGGSYGSVSGGERFGRFNAAVMTVPLDSKGQPEMDESEVTFVVGFVELEELFPTVRSYPAAVTWSPDGDVAMVAMEGSQAVAAMTRRISKDHSDDLNGGFGRTAMVDFADTGFSRGPESIIDDRFGSNASAFVGLSTMPQGLVFTDDSTLWAHSGIQHSIEPVDFDGARDAARENRRQEFESTPSFQGADALALSDRALPGDVQTGRRLFFSAVDTRMSTTSAGVSCSTCHFDGRTDGLTWNLDGLPRQVPSLAGQVSLTEPVTWFDEVSSVADEAMITSQSRMGGDDLSRTQAEYIEAYVDWSRDVDHKDKGAQTEAVTRGQAIFEREDVACSSCHPAPLYTDGDKHDMYGVNGVATPSLIGVAATAPYLHTGSAPSLRGVLETARGGEMGDTSSLSEQEMDDLVAYLRSL